MSGKMDLYINEANDYARDIGAPVWHPHVSVIHYDEVGEIRHSLNRFNVFALFLQREFPENLTYGIGTYHEGDGSLLAYGPGQIGGKRDNGTRRQYHGWVLMFDTHFIHDSEIERRLADYHFFSYNANEALILTAEEKDILAGLIANIRKELQSGNQGNLQDDIIRDYILLILDYCKRFYHRQLKDFLLRSRLGKDGVIDSSLHSLLSQFKEIATTGSDILSRFQQLLIDYYDRGLQCQNGLPSVKYCASELCLSPGYFGDIIRESLGENPKDYIRGFVVMRAKNLLLSGMSVTQVSELLGFEYPNHFTRLFKQITGQTPSQFLNESSGRTERFAEQRQK